MSGQIISGEPMADDWFEQNAHSEQEFRILMSGLKPEGGAWERSIFHMEMVAKEWELSAATIANRRRLLDIAIERNREARVGMPKSRLPRANNFGPASPDIQRPPEPSIWIP